MKKIYLIHAIIILTASTVNAQGPFTGKPRYQILTTQNSATLGIIEVELFPNIAPLHVRNFDSLVNIKFFDTIAFHRVVPGFVIQGGDPNSRSGPVSTWGQGQPGQTTVPAEFSPVRHSRGIFSAARKSNNIHSATSQFFICVANAFNLDNNYSVYGRVTSGMKVVDSIVKTPVVQGTERPVNKVEMFITRIGSNDTVPQKPQLDTPLDSATGIATVVALKWQAVPGALLYELEVADDMIFQNIIDSKTQVDRQRTLTGLQTDKYYYWRVRANNGGHYSDWSETWSFYTGTDETGLNANSLLRFSVAPNPSSGVFTLKGVPINSRIEIHDQQGKLINKTTSTNRNAVVDLHEQAKGLYFYTIFAEGLPPVKGELLVQ